MKNKKKQIEKMAQEAVQKASEAVKSANDALTEAQTALKVMEELSDDDLDQVTGAGNPFQDTIRNQNADLDDSTRKKI